MAFNCDFNAPMFVDFQNEDFDNNPESYFEIDHEAEIGTNFEDEPETFSTPPSHKNQDQETDEQEDKKMSTTTNENKTEIQKRPANMVASWSARRTRSVAPRVETPTRQAQKRDVAEFVETVQNSPKIALPERSKVKRLGTNLGTRPRLDEPKPEASLEPAKKQSSPGLSRWRKVVNQMTPEIIRNARATRLLKQNQKLAQANSNAEPTKTKSFKDQLKMNRILSTKPAPVAPSVVKPLHPTEPKPFNFATDSRIKPSKGPVSADSQVDFLKMLRTYKPESTSSTSIATGPTQVKPFNFSQSSNASHRSRSVEPTPRKRVESDSKYISTAELVKKFQQGTPDRFRSMPRGRSSSAHTYQRRRSPSPQLTRARTPRLMTTSRTRLTNVLSKEEREMQELEEAKKHQFRATGINEGIKPSKPVHVEKKLPTKVEPFHFHSHTRPAPLPAEEPLSDFHAKPVPKKIFEGPVGIPERRAVEVVVPQSPAFALKDRLKERRRHAPTGDDQSAEPEKVIKARPAPHFGVPIIMQNAAKKTVAEPFSFCERDEAMMKKKQQKIAEMLEEEKRLREFKAKPAPNLNKPVNLPIKEVQPPTLPEPFDIQIEKRVEERLQKWQEEVEKERQQQREATNFKAKAPTVLDKQPFQVKPSEKPLCEVSNFELHSDKRAREREGFEQQRKQKEAELEAMKRQLEEKRRLEEEKEILKARKEAVHKAQPIKHYKPIQIFPSSKPITTPISPKFHALHSKKSSSTLSSAGSSNSQMDETYELQEN